MKSPCKSVISNKGVPELVKPAIGTSKAPNQLSSRLRKNDMPTPRAAHSKSMTGLYKLCNLPDIQNVTTKKRADSRRRFQSDDPDQCVRFRVKGSEDSVPDSSLLF